jgi:hypothetical protein
MLGGFQKMWMTGKKNLANLVWHQSLVFLVICGHWCISKHELASIVLGMGVIWQVRNFTRETPCTLVNTLFGILLTILVAIWLQRASKKIIGWKNGSQYALI